MREEDLKFLKSCTKSQFYNIMDKIDQNRLKKMRDFITNMEEIFEIKETDNSINNETLNISIIALVGLISLLF